jgi:hypothetical protein
MPSTFRRRQRDCSPRYDAVTGGGRSAADPQGRRLRNHSIFFRNVVMVTAIA